MTVTIIPADDFRVLVTAVRNKEPFSIGGKLYMVRDIKATSIPGAMICEMDAVPIVAVDDAHIYTEDDVRAAIERFKKKGEAK